MKRNLYVALALVALVCCAGRFLTIAAHPTSQEKHAFTPDSIPW